VKRYQVCASWALHSLLLRLLGKRAAILLGLCSVNKMVQSNCNASVRQNVTGQSSLNFSMPPCHAFQSIVSRISQLVYISSHFSPSP